MEQLKFNLNDTVRINDISQALVSFGHDEEVTKYQSEYLKNKIWIVESRTILYDDILYKVAFADGIFKYTAWTAEKNLDLVSRAKYV